MGWEGHSPVSQQALPLAPVVLLLANLIIAINIRDELLLIQQLCAFDYGAGLKIELDFHTQYFDFHLPPRVEGTLVHLL